MKNFDCNQIKIFINLEIIREENMNKIIYTYFSFNLKKKKNLQFAMKPLNAITTYKPNLEIYLIKYSKKSRGS